MKQTVNINLAGTLFHIDEDAFGKLTRYLEAIRKSLQEPSGSEEIIKDIEARIAELFSEKIESTAQVISIVELDEVIAVMGQPEDYSVDEELFEDEPTASKTYTKSKGNAAHKQLFRDVDTKVISGVSSGLAHYIGIDAIWVRLLWIILIFAGFGSPILVYILLWILVPPAESTTDKLKMTGTPVNISNIEKKVKEGFDTVTDRVKNADYDKFGKQVKTGTSNFFDSLGSLVVALFNIFGKFVGIIIIIVSLSVLIGLVVGMFTFGSLNIWGTGEVMDYMNMANVTNTPLWLVSLLCLFAIGIPFFVLFILGLKLLVKNLRSIGTPAKILLLILWVVSLIALGILGVRLATENGYDGESIIEETLPIRSGDTLRITMNADMKYGREVERDGGLKLKYDENKKQVIYSNDIRLIIRSSKDSVAKLYVEKQSEGNSFLNAKENAEAIEYKYEFANNTLNLDGYFTTKAANKYRGQDIDVYVYLPVGTILFEDENTESFQRNNYGYEHIIDNGTEGHYIKIMNQRSQCIDCPEENWEEEEYDSELENDSPDWEIDVNESLENGNSQANNDNRVLINKNGIDINVKDEKDTLRIKIGN